MLSTRTKLSLCQFLSLQTPLFLSVLFEKHGIPALSGDYQPPDVLLEMLRVTLRDAPEERIQSLLREVVKTHGDLRNRVSPRYRYDERWEDLVDCLKLEGYKIDGRNLVPVDPTIEGSQPVEDDLSAEIRRSGLSEAEEILRLLENSAEAFRRMPPDYNSCLNNARVTLETLVREMAKARQSKYPQPFDETKWGQILAYLRVSDFITEEEERGIAGVYGFVSPGSHKPVGLTEEEMARLARSLVASMCYFLIRRYNG